MTHCQLWSKYHVHKLGNGRANGQVVNIIHSPVNHRPAETLLQFMRHYSSSIAVGSVNSKLPSKQIYLQTTSFISTRHKRWCFYLDARRLKLMRKVPACHVTFHPITARRFHRPHDGHVVDRAIIGPSRSYVGVMWEIGSLGSDIVDSLMIRQLASFIGCEFVTCRGIYGVRPKTSPTITAISQNSPDILPQHFSRLFSRVECITTAHFIEFY